MYLMKDDIQSAAKGREIVFWGCSEDWVPRTKKQLPDVSRIIDIKSGEFPSEWLGLEVNSPQHVITNRDSFYIVITTGSYESVEEILQTNGWVPKEDYCYSPAYQDFMQSVEVANVDATLIFTSSDYGSPNGYRSSRRGGGVYKLDIKAGCVSQIENLFPGSYRQAVFYGGRYFAIEYEKDELHIFDRSLASLERIKLDLRHYTGLAVDGGFAYLTSSAYDCIEIIDIESRVVVHRRYFSNRTAKLGNGAHHLNDCCFYDGLLFFGYFSKSGVWSKEVFDGGISIYDPSADHIGEALSGLLQPHSPTIINNSLHYCESPKGYVYSSSWSRLCSLPGFVRGLSYDKNKYFVGQSENLYMKRATTISNVMMNAGIYILTPETGACRFVQIDGIKNIHSVDVWK